MIPSCSQSPTTGTFFPPRFRHRPGAGTAFSHLTTRNNTNSIQDVTNSERWIGQDAAHDPICRQQWHSSSSVMLGAWADLSF